MACIGGNTEIVHALLSVGARADLRDINGMVPLDLLPRALIVEVERLLQQAKEDRGLPPPHYQSASQLQAACEDGGEV